MKPAKGAPSSNASVIFCAVQWPQQAGQGIQSSLAALNIRFRADFIRENVAICDVERERALRIIVGNIMAPLPKTIGLIDSDTRYAAFLSQYLAVRGSTVTHFASAEEWQDAHETEHAAYLVALVLPGMDGVDLVAVLRQETDVPIIVLSDRLGPDAFTTSLAAGADMFIAKPARGDQIVQGLQAIVRRMAPLPPAADVWTIDADAGVLRAPDGAEIDLSPIERKLVAKLASAHGRSVSREVLAQAAELAESANNRNLDAAMFRLRRKIEARSKLPPPVVTAHGHGYCLIGASLT